MTVNSWRADGPTVAIGEGEVGAPSARGDLYRKTNSLVSTLIAMRGRFKGDLDQYVVYLLFAYLFPARREPEPGRVAANEATAEPTGMNALSIAEITGIPRETVRRKLSALVRAEYIYRRRDGLYYINPHHNHNDGLVESVPLFSAIIS